MGIGQTSGIGRKEKRGIVGRKKGEAKPGKCPAKMPVFGLQKKVLRSGVALDLSGSGDVLYAECGGAWVNFLDMGICVVEGEEMADGEIR